METVKRILFCTTVVFMMLVVVLLFNNNQVKAENVDELSSFSVLKGASVRFGDENGGNGIRFAITMDKAEYVEFMNNHQNVKFGVVIAPYFYYKIYPLNYENLFSVNAKYNWANNIGGEWVYTPESGKARIINLTTGELVDYDSNSVIYNASVVDILEANIQLEYVCAGYVSYDDGFGEVVKFAKYDGDDVTSNVRSMAYVAKSALEELNCIELEKLTPTQIYRKQLLQSNYLDKAQDEYLERIQGNDEFDTANGLTLNLPWDKITSVNDQNSYKFDFVWSVIDKNGLTVSQGEKTLTLPNDCEGDYSLICTAISKATDNEQTVYVSKLSVKKSVVDLPGSDLTTFHRGYGDYSLTALFGDCNGITEFKFYRKIIGGNDVDFETEPSLSLTSNVISGLNSGYYKVVAYKNDNVFMERVLDYDKLDEWVWFGDISEQTELYKYVNVYCNGIDISERVKLGGKYNQRKIEIVSSIPKNNTKGYILYLYNGGNNTTTNITASPVGVQIIPIHSKNYYLEYVKANGENAVLTMDVCQGTNTAQFYDMRSSDSALYTLTSNTAQTVKISLNKLIENWDLITRFDNSEIKDFNYQTVSVYYVENCAQTRHYFGNFKLNPQ